MTKSQWIEQADREAAAAYMKRIRDTRWSVEGILNGGCDNTSVVIAFARHRQQAVAAERERCAVIAETWVIDWARPSGHMPDDIAAAIRQMKDVNDDR